MDETKPRKTNNGPNFMKMLLGKKVVIAFRDGDIDLEGVIRGFNRYEILFKREDDGNEILIMKHAIDVIAPIEEENPFEKKEEEDGNKTRT